jgi:drug/metabolite transporter (DMT)-like permease
MTGTRQRTGVHLALFGTALMWGLNVSAVKALTQQVDVMLVASLRTVLAALALTLLMSTEPLSRQGWTLRTVAWGLVGAALMVYANQTLFAMAMRRTSATNAALIMALAPFVSSCLEAVLFRKRMSALQMAGIALAMIGVAVVIVKGQGSAWTAISSGDLLMLAAVCAFAAGGATVQRLARCASPLSITWFVHVAGAALLMLHTLLVTPDPLRAITALSAWQWSLMLYSGVLATAIGAVAWSRGIATIGVGRTATYLSWVPVFGVGFGALLLDEALNGWHAVGLCAVLCGSLMAARQAERSVATLTAVCGPAPLVPTVACRRPPSP